MFALLLGITPLFAPDAAPVAMVLETTGEVTVQQGKAAFRPARAMRMLFPSDRLKTGDKSGVEIVFIQGDRHERIGAHADVTVKPEGCVPPGKVEKLPAEQKQTIVNGLKTLAVSERGSVKLFRTAPEDEPPDVTPIPESRVLSDHPDLSWPELAKAQSYRVQLNVTGSGLLVWSGKSSKNALAYPEEKKALRRGRSYEWRVYAEVGDDSLRLVAKSVFKVASEQELEDLKKLQKLTNSKKAGAGELLMAALGYHAAGVFGEALTLFERLCEMEPDNPDFHASRADVTSGPAKRRRPKRPGNGPKNSVTSFLRRTNNDVPPLPQFIAGSAQPAQQPHAKEVLPPITDEGTEALRELVKRCAEGGALQFRPATKSGSSRIVLIDNTKLTVILRDNRDLISPALCVYWVV